MDTVPHQRVCLILTVGHLWLHGIYHLLHGRQLSSNGWQKMSPNLPVQSCKPDKIELMSMFTKALSWFMLFLAKQHLAIGKITYFHTDIFIFILFTSQRRLYLFSFTCDFNVTFKESIFLYWFIDPIVNLYWYKYMLIYYFGRGHW